MTSIRNERPTDAAAIDAVTLAAFMDAAHSDQTEHLIVRGLRSACALSVSLVAEDDGAIIGHVAVSPVTLSSGDVGWHGLGPISVRPERQGNGIGDRLMRAALGELRSMGASGCVVLGDPRFYSRFGFIQAPALALPGAPPEYFLALSFGDALPAGTVSYHPAFATKA